MARGSAAVVPAGGGGIRGGRHLEGVQLLGELGLEVCLEALHGRLRSAGEELRKLPRRWEWRNHM